MNRGHRVWSSWQSEAVDDTNEEGTAADDDAEEEVPVADAACGFLPFSQVIL